MGQHKSFAALEEEFSGWDHSSIAILPVPYDKTSTWVKGADKGPSALIEASSAVELYDIETDSEVYRQGIFTCPPFVPNDDPEEMVREVETEVVKLLDSGKFVVTLGGEHSVSIGAVMAHRLKAKDLFVLQLDAHLDRREEYEGSRYNHACVMARIKEVCPVVQTGIRSMSVEEKEGLATDCVFFAKDIVNNDSFADNVMNCLSENVYVSIDLDVFDPAVMPSTGTPEPGGLDWYQVMKLLKMVSEKKNVVGFDVVELCPDEKNKAPDFTAAKLVYKFLSYIHANK